MSVKRAACARQALRRLEQYATRRWARARWAEFAARHWLTALGRRTLRVWQRACADVRRERIRRQTQGLPPLEDSLAVSEARERAFGAVLLRHAEEAAGARV